MKHKRATLKWKMFTILASFIAIILALLWIFQLLLVDDIYRVMKSNNIRKSADLIALNIDNDNIDTLINRISYTEETSVVIIDMSGKLLHRAEAKYDIINRLSEETWQEKIERAKSTKGSFLEIVAYASFMNDGYNPQDFLGKTPTSNSDKLESIIYARVIKNDAGAEFGLLLDTTITPFYTASKVIVLVLAIISVGVLLLALAVTFVLSKSVVNPIISLTASANELAKGQTDVDFSGGRYQEIMALGDALNYAANEISKVEHLRRELISNVSHDLRTPLTLIQGYGEMMRDIPEENTPESLQVIIDETERLTRIVDDMLNLSKIQDGGDKLNLSAFDIVRTIKTLVNNHGKLLKGQGYKIEFNHEDTGVVMADESKISQVVYNLLNNAVNYSGEDKLVVINQFTKGNNVRVEVIDNGEGIDVASLPHIWDRYYKSEKSHKRSTVGTGLGLYIVKNIIKLHPDAKYGVESSIGRGSKFYIELPLYTMAKRNKK